MADTTQSASKVSPFPFPSSSRYFYPDLLPQPRRPSKTMINGSDDQHIAGRKKRSWSTLIPRPGSSGGRSNNGAKRPSSSGGFRMKEGILPLLTPQEGKELIVSPSPSIPATPESTHSQLPSVGGSGVPLSRATTLDPTPPPSRPTTPRRWSNNFLLTYSPKPSTQNFDQYNSGFDRIDSLRSPDSTASTKSPTFGGKSLPSILGLSSLTLSRTSTRDSGNDEKDRGRSMFSLKRSGKSSSQVPSDYDGLSSRSVSRARSQSPFSFRRFAKSRESSPTPPSAIPLSQSDAELSDYASYSAGPRNSAFSDDDSGGEDDDSDEDSSSDAGFFDSITERNTERNAIIQVVDGGAAGPEAEEPDPIGEGVNIVVAPEPYFPSTLNTTDSGIRGRKGSTRKRKNTKAVEPLVFSTSRPVFQRDRCTIVITQGEPEAKVVGRKRRRYVVASDLSEESRYAVEWGIGTVLRDGDEMLIVTVVENESKTDPSAGTAADKSQKLRSQQERQGLAYILARQVTGLVQRTRLHVTISCQAWHAKNSRHMLLDVVDHVDPIMLIVGSRGLGHLNGILLGSTSHYLIQKCSVPVMVARRRLKRPPKRNAHLATHRQHVSLAEAGIDRVAAKVDQDVQVMRDEMQKDDIRRDGGPGSREERGAFTRVDNGEHEQFAEPEDEPEIENDDEELGPLKVAG